MQTRRLAGITPDPKLFPNWDSGLRVAMKQENLAVSAVCDIYKPNLEKAESMAKAAGGSLGTALEIMTNDVGEPRPVMFEAAMMSARGAAPETPIAVGEEKVRVTVTVRWQFVTGR